VAVGLPVILSPGESTWMVIDLSVNQTIFDMANDPHIMNGPAVITIKTSASMSPLKVVVKVCISYPAFFFPII
jgi:hypothetical protein